MKRRGAARRATIADLEDKPGHLIRRAYQVTSTIFEAAAGSYSVTPAQHIILTALSKHPGIDQKTLATLVALDTVTVGQVVTRLEGRGLVQRIDSPTDRRSWTLTLTGTGLQLLRRMQAAVRRSQSDLLSPLSPAQRKQFFTIMRRLVGMTPPYRRKPQ
jgi:DNA-binding MarR family transcriptional regulator